jgi:hypothetical protein
MTVRTRVVAHNKCKGTIKPISDDVVLMELVSLEAGSYASAGRAVNQIGSVFPCECVPMGLEMISYAKNPGSRLTETPEQGAC